MSEKSFSPISNHSYTINTNSDESVINDFLDKSSREKTVAVQGLGFVGTVMSLVVANSDDDEYNVIGVDTNKENSYWKIADINNGIVPLSSSDPKVQEYFDETQKRKNFLATHDTDAFSHADVIIIDINLDVKKEKTSDNNLKSYDVPMEGFKSAIRSIAEKCKEDVLILVETTVPPGTCSKVILPIIKEGLLLRGLSVNKFKLGHSYERVMPGPNYINSIKNFYRVFSGIDNQSADAVESFLKTIISTDEYPLTRLQSTESTEIAKVLENSYRAMNISFMIEWSRLAEQSGVNIYEVVDAIRLRPTHSNLMYPGIGVGGYCLTKDPLLASWASANYFGLSKGLPFSKLAVEQNDKMPEYAFEFVMNIIKDNSAIKNIGLLGVAYGPGIGDTRFSPVEGFITKFNDEYIIKCHDPFVSFWEERNLKIENELEEFLKDEFDLLIISTAHADYLNSKELFSYLDKKLKPLVIDTVGLFSRSEYFNNYPKDKYHVLGNGKIYYD